MAEPETTAVPVGDESYVEDRLGNTLAVVQGNEHVWIDVLFAGDDPSDKGNWHQVATLLPAQARNLIAMDRKPETTTKYAGLWEGPKTVADFIELLSTFPKDWPVKVSTSAGGGIGIEHRDISGKPVVAIFGKTAAGLARTR